MDNSDTDSPYTPQLPPATAAEREAVYASTQEAIKSRNMKQAHHLLLKMIQVDGSNPELWLLLAWTAPSRRDAGVFFEHLLQVQPDYPLAICGVAWSGIEWSPSDNTQLTGNQSGQPAQTTGSLEQKYRGRQTGELPSPTAALGSRSLNPKTGELGSATARDKLDRVRQTGELSTSSVPLDRKPHKERTGELVTPAVPGERPRRNPQTEWLEPAAWSVENGAADYPFLDDGESGARIYTKHLAASFSTIGFVAFLALYFLGILSAELVTVYRSPLLGQAYHGALLILILLYAMFSAGTKKQKLLLALGLAPLIRLISLSTPQLDLNFPISYIIIGIILLIASLGVLRLAGFKREQVGLAPGKYFPVQLGIGLVGIGLGFLEYLIIRPEPLANRSSLPGILLAALVLFLFPGFIEELIFRGLMQRASTSIYKRAGPLYVSLIFTILHIGYRSWLDLIFVFLVALVFSVVVEQTRSLLGVTLAHGLANISLFLIFPYLLVAPLQNNPILPAPSVLVNSPAIWSAPGSLIPQSEVITVPTATGTATVSPASVIPSDTPVFSLTPSPTVAFTMTFTPSPTFTLTRTPSPWISPTATRSRTRTPTPTSRNTLTPTAIIITSTLTAIDTPSESPTPTQIPTDVLPIETP